MLDEIEKAIGEVGLVRPLPASTQLFRGRIGPARRPYRSANKLGPPPPHKAIYANRMSPAGIPMFYGAFDEYTAIRETIFGRLKKGEVVNVGRFLTLEEFLVLDLTRLPPIPSLFSEDRYLRPVLTLARGSSPDTSAPLPLSGAERTGVDSFRSAPDYRPVTSRNHWRYSSGTGTNGGD